MSSVRSVFGLTRADGSDNCESFGGSSQLQHSEAARAPFQTYLTFLSLCWSVSLWMWNQAPEHWIIVSRGSVDWRTSLWRGCACCPRYVYWWRSLGEELVWPGFGRFCSQSENQVERSLWENRGESSAFSDYSSSGKLGLVKTLFGSGSSSSSKTME